MDIQPLAMLLDAHRIRIWTLAVVIAVTGLAAPIYGSSEQTGKPELKTASGAGDGFDSWVKSEIVTGVGVRLKLTQFKKEYDGQDYSTIEKCEGYSEIPQEVSDGSSYTFCYACMERDKGYDTGFFFHYDILVPNGTGGWMPSGYWVDGATKVPMIGSRHLDCTIRRSGSMNPADGAPFSCGTSWTGSGNTSQPHWKVTAKDVTVIDASYSANAERAAKLIGDNCQVFDTPRCFWTRTQKSSTFLPERSDWQSLTNWADSCPPTDPKHLFVLTSKRNVQISWSDKVGGKISAQMGAEAFVAKVKGTIEANYEHSITQTDRYGEGYQYTIPYNHRAALYLQHGFLEVSGDFSIITDNDRFLVKNAVFRFPLEKDVQVEGRGQPVPRGVVQHVDIPCSEKPPSDGAPPPARAKYGLATKSPGQ
jgi:hypothetical protein